MAAMSLSVTGRARLVSGRGESAGNDHRPLCARRLCDIVRAAGAVAICAAFATGCGDSAQKSEARKVEGTSILSRTAPLAQRLVKQGEVAGALDSAAQQTFLRFWSTLQFGAWDQAEQFFQPGLRNTIGSSTLAQALGQYILIWQGTKPRIVTARVTGGTATITFFARDEADHVIPASISFQRSSRGVWQVSFFSLLDPALQRAVQLRTQAQVDPLGTKPSAEAVRQGNVAASLQSLYLERQLHAAREETSQRAGGGH
jgi:hypothetical protein